MKSNGRQLDENLTVNISRNLAGLSATQQNGVASPRIGLTRLANRLGANNDWREMGRLLPAIDAAYRKHLLEFSQIPFGNVLNNLFAFVFVLERDATVVEVNHAALEATGVAITEVAGKKFWECIWWDYDASIRAQLRRACEQVACGESARYNVAIRMADARLITIDFMLAPIKDADGKVTHMVASAVDITEGKKIEDAYRDLGGRLIGSQDAERQHVARELHDDLSQRIALLALGIQQLDRKVPDSESPLHSHIRQLWEKTQEISADMHRLSHQLHPANLDHLGLVASVQGFCDELYQHHGLQIEFQHRGFPTPLKSDVRLCLFRIVQEALNNVIRHSGVHKAIIRLDKSDQRISLSVSDQGSGFDVESVRLKGGLGLISMSERLRPMGGEISIRSQPLQGTQITVLVPLVSQP